MCQGNMRGQAEVKQSKQARKAEALLGLLFPEQTPGGGRCPPPMQPCLTHTCPTLGPAPASRPWKVLPTASRGWLVMAAKRSQALPGTQTLPGGGVQGPAQKGLEG